MRLPYLPSPQSGWRRDANCTRIWWVRPVWRVTSARLALPSGALVKGLGKWGELTAGQQGDLLRRAALQYLLELRENLDAPREGDAPALGLSILLIGGNSTASITVADSVAAILRAIAQVNRELATPDGASPSVREVEIVELYADTAIEAAHAVKRLAPLIGKELGTEIEAAPLLQRFRPGCMHMRLALAVFDRPDSFDPQADPVITD